MIAKQVKTAALYLRMSSDIQDESIGSQRAELEQLAAHEGYKIVREYVDEGISGDSKRQGLESLLRDAETLRDFDAVLVWHTNRFSRSDPLDTAAYWRRLRDADVVIHSKCQGVRNFSNFSDLLISNVEQHGDNAFLKEHAQKVIRGRVNGIERGRHQAPAPFGYSKKDCKLIPDVDADTVKWLFNRLDKYDVSIGSLARELNTKGTTTKRGNLWLPISVKGVLQNPVYLGRLVWGRVSSAAHARYTVNGTELVKRRETQRRTANEVLVQPDTHDALIDQATFDRVQQKLAIRAERGCKPREKSGGLTGVICCGHCGAGMSRISAPRKTSHSKRYQCNSRNRVKQRLPECHATFDGAVVLELIRHRLNENFLSEEQIDSYRERVIKHLKEQRATHSKTSATIKAKQADIAAKLLKAESRLLKTPDDMLPTLYNQIRELRSQAGNLAQEMLASGRIQNLSEEAVASDAGRVVAFLRRVKEGIESDDPAVFRASVLLVVERVDVFFSPRQSGPGKWQLRDIAIQYKPDLAADDVIPNAKYVGTNLSFEIKALLRIAH